MSAASWSRRLLLGGCVAVLAACAHKAAPPLYAWGTFPRLQYDTLLANGISPVEQVGAMETQLESARASGAALPPGFRAHLGMLKLAAGDPLRARALWQEEKAAFPESSLYMDQLLKRLDPPANKDKPT